ncbi:NADH-quinone oxidoreductase subunit J [Aeromicrobium sp. UC242_57]|uniref:NADH-quinone oxidoreductase subunit J n=1 Tax=Aeromicrobium sp. UC242_57 TaxID=3374624 RepID=UPI0037AE5E69
MTTFWILAPIMVIAALGLLFAKKAVHAALALAVVMISLAVLYAAQGAPFLFAVQIIVYTGAIMMLFLFVLMLVGVDNKESLRETIGGQRLAATIVGLLFGIVAVTLIGQTVSSPVVGLTEANANGNVEGLAALMFGPYTLAVQFTAALLITAVLGAMVMAHHENLTPRRSQADLSRQRMRDYAESGVHPGNAPTPGVFARHNAVDTPALLPDGSPLEESISPSIVERDQVRHSHMHDVEKVVEQLKPTEEEGK